MLQLNATPTMSAGRDEGPVYYREIQKNAYLKRIPTEPTSSKLRPLGHKKVSLKPMWTMFCVHNGRTPFLEQYPEAESPAAVGHKPVWRACLKTARHVTASVKPHVNEEYDFLIDTDHGPVRMLAPDWATMQDWVTSLRNKLQELKVLSGGENVYGAPPAAAPPRAPARDPTSPLPPTPPVPPDRVPGIELNPTPRTVDTTPRPETPEASVDISNWDPEPIPSTSQERTEPRKGVTKICGQNICLDDSVLRRENTESDEEFFNEMDRREVKVESETYKQTVLVSNGDVDDESDQGTNVTVIQVSNKDPPHTAIPVLGSDTEIFNFNFKQNVTITNEEKSIINVTTEPNDYGTVFSKDYGHLSLTTTVNLTGNDRLYERLCMASTSQTNSSPERVRRFLNRDKQRKSSLPNLEGDSTYECLFPSQSGQNNGVGQNDGDSPNDVASQNDGTGQINQYIENQANLVNESVNNNQQISTPAISNLNSNVRVISSNIERSQSQNAYDSSPRSRLPLIRKVENMVPKRDDKSEQAKPIWKRGLTELVLLTRFRGNNRRQETPATHEDNSHRSATTPVKVVRRSRPEVRDTARRRSSSLSNGDAVCALVPLRTRQAAALRAEQARGAALPATVRTNHPPVFCEYDQHLWVSWWGGGAAASAGRAGDRVAALRGAPVRSLAHAALLLAHHKHYQVDMLFHRVPLAKIYVLNKRDNETIGIKLDNECNIVSVEENSPAGRAGLPAGRWALTEVNNRPINLLKGGEEEMNRLSMRGTEVSILIQPSALVKKIRGSLKGNKSLFSIR